VEEEGREGGRGRGREGGGGKDEMMKWLLSTTHTHYDCSVNCNSN